MSNLFVNLANLYLAQTFSTSDKEIYRLFITCVEIFTLTSFKTVGFLCHLFQYSCIMKKGKACAPIQTICTIHYFDLFLVN